MVAIEFDMWSVMPPPMLAIYWQHYLSSYVAFSSNTQMAELSIKGANYCQIWGQNYKCLSLFATTRNKGRLD
jgi:hypothetical protein